MTLVDFILLAIGSGRTEAMVLVTDMVKMVLGFMSRRRSMECDGDEDDCFPVLECPTFGRDESRARCGAVGAS